MIQVRRQSSQNQLKFAPEIQDYASDILNYIIDNQ